MSEEQIRMLEKQLWAISNALRGKMNPDEFKHYILGFIFYKYLSEKMVKYADDLLTEDGLKYQEIESSDNSQDYINAVRVEAIESLGYFLAPSELFSSIAEKTSDSNEVFVIEELERILTNIQNTTMGTGSEDDFVNLFEDMDLNSSKLGKNASDRNRMVSMILSNLNKVDFEIDNNERDILGDAYEYLIAQFAAGAGKKAGEFYTPQSVSTILAKIVSSGKDKIKSVYDPTCGSGSLLLRVAKEVDSVSNFYGQEMNRTTYNLARMNMIMHDVHYTDFSIQLEDTLEHPQHTDERFEAIVANPPFSANWSANNLFLTDDRFSRYGKLAPKSKADYAFIQHMLHQLDDNGTMATVFSHGVLFRGAAEGHIRKHIIEEMNFLDAVITLPGDIFYGTNIETCILVFKKCRENKDNILFINASQEFEKGKSQNVLTKANIAKIVETYEKRVEIEKFSHIASLDEVRENDYNLNISRYVDTFEEEELVDLDAVAEQIRALDLEMKSTDATIAKFCEELGIKAPF